MLRFVTGNEGKLREARAHLPVPVEGVAYDYVEIQSGDLAEIAAHGARDAFDATGGEDAVLVDDAGLFVDALGGFPGPYSAYVEDTLGIERVWQLVEDTPDRRASFRAVVAYTDGETLETFEGVVRGRLVAPRGDGGFGYDPIFEHDGRTFAEMTVEEKNALSHRGRALGAFAAWYAEQL